MTIFGTLRKCLLKTLGKGENACKRHFLVFPHFFFSTCEIQIQCVEIQIQCFK